MLAPAFSRGAILITGDKDFGDLVFRQQHQLAGVRLLRLHGWSPHAKAATALAAIQEHTAYLDQAFTVISPGQVRIRPRG